MVKLVNGESHGMFILTVEPKELTIVLILGPINMDELGELRGVAGLGALGSLGGVQHSPHGKGEDKDKEKAKEKADKGGDQ
jgi:citrate lyase alpha subunit